ncbi:MAG: hypothetical protein SRB2_01233 [Desulfobacteraceae bacterium Eth-SRB2]|nr:MAG: hypothetical protein SRB2_01233 [Desulfobacteraceae bacterium Eth-SRB2]
MIFAYYHKLIRNLHNRNKPEGILLILITSKNPGPEGPALIIPRGDLVCRHLTIYGVLEYWSGGVMEETPFFIALRKQIPGENLKI